MPSGFDDDAPNAPLTMRGRNWPCLRQFCVFMENRVGCLHELLRQLEGRSLRIIALTVVDTVEFAVARIMVDDSDRVREILTLEKFTFVENDILGVELAEGEDPFANIFRTLVSAEINISYTYPLIYRRSPRGAIAVYVDNIDQARVVLQEHGHHVLSENDLHTDDFF
ncbi:acetolactate synthase [Planctomicrobium sp. SH664]|uniref:acetolactate synthase n=1 Tax=Planctomicrobium sp. SH664 TaxID=3448125 RepID=UPI003F5C7B9F